MISPAAILATARAVADTLHAQKVAPYAICCALGHLLTMAGITAPTAQDLVRELPGLSAYDHMAEYRRRNPPDPADADGLD